MLAYLKAKPIQDIQNIVTGSIISTDIYTKLLLQSLIAEAYTTHNNEIFMVVNTYHKELINQTYYERANALKLLSSLPQMDVKYIVLAALKKNAASINPYVKLLMCTALVKLKCIGDIP